ncbi:hypothetical protein [Mycobacterium sp.]|uniref:hypothetical protein n=1 Tax=Mycobacterium sp. TaxID=1785 RepID=UPI002C52F788|nr:hypothetical protein [Mycobacterium sp.]HME48297.1 hypothetical protein [Mycobacterium sp.]
MLPHFRARCCARRGGAELEACRGDDFAKSFTELVSQVAWSVISNTVNDGKTIYAPMCPPTDPGPFPAVVYNHGGINGTPFNLPDSASLHGQLSAIQWTSRPDNSPNLTTHDDLGQCVDWARRGWTVSAGRRPVSSLPAGEKP